MPYGGLQTVEGETIRPDGDGPLVGGTLVQLHGAYLGGTTSVTVGGSPATITEVMDDRIRFITPAGTVGTADVVVTTPRGSATALEVFTYWSVPTVDSVDAHRFGSSVYDVVVTGTGFRPGFLSNKVSIVVDGEPAGVTSMGDTMVIGSIVLLQGVYDLTITTPGGSLTLEDGVTVAE